MSHNQSIPIQAAEIVEKLQHAFTLTKQSMKNKEPEHDCVEVRHLSTTTPGEDVGKEKERI